jgi:putative transposase
VITKLKGPRKWSYYYLYVILNVFSRCVVGWCIAERENAAIAEALIQETLLRQNIQPGALTIHADRGSAMTSITVAQLLIDLGVTKSHSRPHHPEGTRQRQSVLREPLQDDEVSAPGP